MRELKFVIKLVGVALQKTKRILFFWSFLFPPLAVFLIARAEAKEKEKNSMQANMQAYEDAQMDTQTNSTIDTRFNLYAITPKDFNFLRDFDSPYKLLGAAIFPPILLGVGAFRMISFHLKKHYAIREEQMKRKYKNYDPKLRFPLEMF